MNILRVVVVGGLLVSTYIAITCPCPVYLECHKEQFFGGLLAAFVAGLVSVNS